MTYEELKKTMEEFRMGTVDKLELTAAIALWQRKEFGRVAW